MKGLLWDIVAVEVLYLFKTHMGHIAADRQPVMVEVVIVADNLLFLTSKFYLLCSYIFIMCCIACQVLSVVVAAVYIHQVMVVITYLVEVM